MVWTGCDPGGRRPASQLDAEIRSCDWHRRGLVVGGDPAAVDGRVAEIVVEGGGELLFGAGSVSEDGERGVEGRGRVRRGLRPSASRW